jgi:predicted N-acyltransferase
MQQRVTENPGVAAAVEPPARSRDARELSARLLDPAEWDALLEQFPQRTVFHEWAWLTTLQREHRLSIHLVAAEDDLGLAALWPVLETRKGPFRVLGSPLRGWSTAYMGPLVAPRADPVAAVDAMMSHPRLRKSAYFECRVCEIGQQVDLSHAGFTLTQQFETYLLDLTKGEQDLWQNLQSECRNRIRKAEKTGIEIVREMDDQFIDDFWTMSQEVFARSGLQPSFTRSFMQTMWRELEPSGALTVLSAKHDSRRIAALVLLRDQHTMYYWAGGSTDAGRNLGANNLLHWRAILEARASGLRSYDFISSRGGPGRFKKTFNPAACIAATHWSRAGSKLMVLLKNWYERYLWWKRKARSAGPA